MTARGTVGERPVGDRTRDGFAEAGAPGGFGGADPVDPGDRVAQHDLGRGDCLVVEVGHHGVHVGDHALLGVGDSRRDRPTGRPTDE